MFKFSNHYLVAFWVTLSLSIALIVGGFFCPPMGEISGSVITAVGELFLWPSLALGAKALSEGRKIQIHKGEMEININENN